MQKWFDRSFRQEGRRKPYPCAMCSLLMTVKEDKLDEYWSERVLSQAKQLALKKSPLRAQLEGIACEIVKPAQKLFKGFTQWILGASGASGQ